MQEIAVGGFSLVPGKFLMVHFKDEAVSDAARQHLDAGKLDLIGRMEGGWYSRTRERFEMPAIEDWRQGHERPGSKERQQWRSVP